MRFTQPVTHPIAHKAELGVLDPAWHTAILDVTAAAAAVEWRSLNWFGLPLSPPRPLCKYNYGGRDEATAALNGHFYCGGVQSQRERNRGELRGMMTTDGQGLKRPKCPHLMDCSL